MSTENTSAETTETVAAAPKTAKVQPDNQYQDILPEIKVETEVATTTKKSAVGKVQPNNQYQDGAPKD